jgi:ribonuclease Z
MAYDKRTWKFPGSGFTLTGHSRSAETTGFYIPELGWALDAGLAIDKDVNHVFVTHGHLDHSYNMPSMLSRHHYTKIFAPPQTATYISTFMHSAMQLNDTQEIPFSRRYSVHAAAPGETYEIEGKKKYYVKIVECNHSIPCVGYCFLELRSKLKEQYKDMKGNEIGKLRKSGVSVTDDIFCPLFVFMGDTTTAAFAKNPDLFEFPIIITECTFLVEEHTSEAEDRGHTSWSTLRPYVEAHPNTTFILIHFSLRYKDAEILEFFNNCKLPNVIAWVDPNLP